MTHGGTLEPRESLAQVSGDERVDGGLVFDKARCYQPLQPVGKGKGAGWEAGVGSLEEAEEACGIDRV